MTLLSSFYLQKRGIVETIIGHLKDFKHLISSKYRSTTNLFMNIFSSITAYQLEENKSNLGLKLRLEMWNDMGGNEVLRCWSNEFARDKNHFNEIENFCSFTKRRLAKFNGLTDENFLLHLKKCEFRYSTRESDLYKILLKMIRKNSFK